MKTIKSLAAILLAVNLLASFAYGASVSYDDAKDIAVNLIYSKTGKSVTIDDSVLDSGTGKEFHIIRLKPKGWVIVSGDDSVKPVIAYSSESSLGTVDSLPSGFVAWMDNVDKQIKEAKDADTQSDAALEEKWKKLTAYPEDFRVDGTSYKSNDGYVQDVILAVTPEGSDTSKSATASGGIVADGWYAVDVTADSSSVDDGEGLGSDGSAGEAGGLGADETLGARVPPAPTNVKASDGGGDSVFITYSGNGVNFELWRSDTLGSPIKYIYTTRAHWAADRGVAGKKYYYYVKACYYTKDSCGALSAPDIGWWGKAAPTPPTPPTPTKPATPTGIKASDGTYTTGVMISNYSVSNATGYKIYRNNIYMGWTKAIRILDTTAKPGIYYNYSVKAYNSAGDSGMSATDKGWIGSAAPSAPTTISASDGAYSSGVVIGSYSVYGATHYKFYRATSAYGAKRYLGLRYSPVSSAKDTTAWPGYKYYYFVKACNSKKQCSAYSAYNTGWRAKLASTIPATPSVSATDGTLTSGVVIKFYSAKTTSYKVYRNGMFIGATAGTSFKDTEGIAGRKYTYSAKACNSKKQCSGLGYDSGSRKSDIPAASRGVSASDGTLTSGVLVKWGSVSGAVQYLIYRDGAYKGATYGTSWKDETAWQDHKYNYSVKAKNKAGVKSDMSASDVGWRKRLPSPSGVKATTTLTSGIVIINYKVNGATHYKIYRFHPSYSSPKLIKDTKDLSYKDTTAAYNTKYSYYATACNSGGCSVSSYAASGMRRSYSPLAPPRSITASDGLTSGIVLKNYSSSGATSYKFYRSTYSDGRNAIELSVNYAPTSWKDTYAKSDTFYYYRVKACNKYGCSDLSTAVDRGWRRR